MKINKTVFHGKENHDNLNDDILFFSSSENFSKDYGKVELYNLTLNNPFHTCNEKDITKLLKIVDVLVDNYDDSEYKSYNELEDSGLLYTDTWELFEAYIKQIKSLGYDGMVIYEGGIENYVSFSSEQYYKKNFDYMSEHGLYE